MNARMDKAQAIAQHILRHLSVPRRFPPGTECSASKPLIVGISGPQGIGKTTLTNRLVSELSSAPHNLRVFSFSTDDLYLPFKEQEALSQRYPGNKLIEFRGLPGTHDVPLGAATFRALCHANDHAHSRTPFHGHPTPISVPIPAYDKALNAGRGDQISQDQWPRAEAPIDIILFEGWSLGFKSVRDPDELREIYQSHSTFPPYYLGKHPFSSIEAVNRSLEAYEREWYSYLDVFVHLSAPNLATVFKWRAEQERDLWARKGSGMTEDQVREFVSRFMPAYEVYLERLQRENVFKDGLDEPSSSLTGPDGVSPTGRHLRVDLDEDRDLISATLVE